MDNTQSSGKISSGIPGLDDMTGGGMYPGTVNVLIGEPGTGRTIFGFQFLHKGLEHGLNGMFISLNHTKEYMLDKYLARYPGDKEYINKKIYFVHLMPENLMTLSDAFGFEMTEVIRELNLGRIVVDPFSAVEDHLISEGSLPDSADLFRVFSSFREGDATTIFITRSDPNKPIRSYYGFAELFADDVAALFRKFPDNDYLKPYYQLFLLVKQRGEILETARVVKYNENGEFALITIKDAIAHKIVEEKLADEIKSL
ncbi:MAG: ATPase domain-containing protein [Methanocorpusculum sp.]|nr:ATPase domain-containing protein [Methanocorpusculum sp.]